MSDTIFDGLDNELEIGSTVRVYGTRPDDELAKQHGKVVSISDADGDADDEGRPVFYPPQVYVRFFDGVEDSFHVSTRYADAYVGEFHYECEDLELVAAGWHA